MISYIVCSFVRSFVCSLLFVVFEFVRAIVVSCCCVVTNGMVILEYDTLLEYDERTDTQ